MNVAVLSKSDGTGGGGGRVADQLCAGLIERGHEAVHYVRWSSAGFGATMKPLYGQRPLSTIINRAHRALRFAGFPEAIPFELASVMLARIAASVDIVHVHDASSAISPLTIRYLARRRPTFWTLHDCSAFTGGCLYPLGCERFRDRCGSHGGCPRLGEWPLDTRFDHTGFMQSMKARVHRNRRIRTLAPSVWMADTAFASGKLPERPAVLSNGVDTNVFTPPADRRALRVQLDLPSDRPIVLLSAGWLDDERKGIRPAIAALHAIGDQRPFVLLVGTINDALRAALGGLDYTATGFIGDEAVLARWYGAADVFLFCSLGDNQPLAVLETMACGVPMVGFATGGIPELVADGFTGALVAPGDAPALIAALRNALVPNVAQAWGEAARLRADERFGRERFIDRHIEAYECALDERRTRASQQRN